MPNGFASDVASAPPPVRRTVAVRGRVDAHRLDELERELAAALRDAGVSVVEVDMSRAEFIGAPVVAVLVEAHFRALQRGRVVRTVGSRGQVRTYLERCGLATVETGGNGPNEPAPVPARWWRTAVRVVRTRVFRAP